MPLRLLVLRHAKSDWEASYRGDHQRPLAPRGREAAKAMGRFLAAVERTPDLVLCSSARRTRETVELAAEAGAWSSAIEWLDELYGTSAAGVLAVVRRHADEPAPETLLVVGHEPTCSELLALLAGAQVRYPTAALASLRLSAATWRAIEPGRGILEWMLTPKVLRRAGLDGPSKETTA